MTFRLRFEVGKIMRGAAKKFVYSSVVRVTMRGLRARHRTGSKVLAGDRLTSLLESGLAERISSQKLPKGMVYGKLTLRDWSQHIGKDFILTSGDQIIYGNRIERPQRGFPLEYRNFVVRRSDIPNLSLSINCPFVVQGNEGEWTTSQQREYDKKYSVELRGSLHYCLRGNLKNPRKLLVTFPGFGPSSTRVSYAVSYLQFLPDDVINDAALLAFQDRNGVAGTYMCFDHAGRPLLGKLEEMIRSYLVQFDLSENDLLLFGASKGGTIALLAGERFPGAELVLVVPQLDLDYYFSKPFFLHNLGVVPGFGNVSRPGDLLLRYAAEGRVVHYLTSYDDELSNVSVGDFSIRGEGFRKYRFACAHGEVARAAVPLILAVVRRFVLGEDVKEGAEPPRVRFFPVMSHEGAFRLQLRMGRDGRVPSNSLVFAGMYEDGVSFFQELTASATPGMAYSTDTQQVNMRWDPIAGEISFFAVDKVGRLYESRGARSSLDRELACDRLVGPQKWVEDLVVGDSYMLSSANELAVLRVIRGGASFKGMSVFSMLCVEQGCSTGWGEGSRFDLVVEGQGSSVLLASFVRRVWVRVRAMKFELAYISSDGEVSSWLWDSLLDDRLDRELSMLGMMGDSNGG